ncbi:MAG: arginine--tRNA ligase [Candidatus Paceibacterota bacterium]
MESKIKNLINEALKNLGIEGADFAIEHPADLKMGDYSTNVAMVLSKKLGESPRELAQKIATSMSRMPLGMIEKIESAGPGFINFYLSKDFFVESIKEILGNKDFGKNDLMKGKRVMVEYTDPNPFKPFHIGHLMSNSIGESIARLVEYSNAVTIRANYQGDIGLHVAKATWGLMHKGKPDENLSTEDQAEYIGMCYSFASNLYEDDENTKKEIDAINKKIYTKEDPQINALYEWGRKVTLEAFETVYKKLGTKFVHYFFESEMAPIGKKIVLDNTPDVFEESDGAIVFKAEKHDSKLHTRVFISSQGLPTYECKEIGLTVTKFEKENPDLSVIITAIEQGEYMRVVQKAVSLIHPDYEKRMKHITHGMLRFATGKMSSRKGNVITGESLIKDVSGSILEKIKDRDFTDTEREKVSIQVGVAALKYSILKQGSGSDVIYDFEKSISFEGDSGPYMQYSYARAKTLLDKARKEGVMPSTEKTAGDIMQIEKMLYRFPEVVSRSSSEFEPHYVASYLIEIARVYNSFYGNTQIVNKEDSTSPYKVALTAAFAEVMQNGLYLLGIETPEKM